MQQIIDWEYYSSHFPQTIPQDQFDWVEEQAETEYREVIKPYMEVSNTREKDCIFKLCNFIYANSEVLYGKGVTSVSNNGYSESYGIQNFEQASEQMRELIYRTTGIRLAGAF